MIARNRAPVKGFADFPQLRYNRRMKIYFLDGRELADEVGRYARFLSPARLAQVESMARSAARRERIAAELALYAALSRECPEYLPIRYARDERGRPYFPDGKMQFSLTHAGGSAACALSRHAVGVDMEFPRRVTEKLASRIFCPGDEGAPLLLWTAKECVMKMTGRGLSLAPREIRVTGNAAVSSDGVSARLFSFDLPGGGILTAASETEERAELVTLREWEFTEEEKEI